MAEIVFGAERYSETDINRYGAHLIYITRNTGIVSKTNPYPY